MKLKAFTVLAYSYYVGWLYYMHQYKAMPTNNANYSCRIKTVELV